ncbi:MAG: cytochrome b [Beijerinckiaceae bacterium]
MAIVTIPARRYDPVAISLHWLIAGLVIVAYAVGLYRETLPRNDFRAWLLSFHMWVGMAVFMLTLARMAWRANRPAMPPVSGPRWQMSAAKVGHIALYCVTIALPVIGLVSAWLKARNVTFFNIAALPSPFAVDKPFGQQLEDVHSYAGHALMILAGGHGLAAIVHQYVLRDGTLGRMVPFVSAQAVQPRDEMRATEQLEPSVR